MAELGTDAAIQSTDERNLLAPNSIARIGIKYAIPMLKYFHVQKGGEVELFEYIETVDDESRKGMLVSAFNAALECIEQHRIANRIDNEELYIHIYEEDEVQALASEDNRNIRFSTGLVKHYEMARFPDLLQVLPEAPYVIGANWVMDLGLAWSLSHEYIHIIRCHDSTVRNIDHAREVGGVGIPLGQKAALSLSKESVDKACEHDADLCAASGIYRYLQRRSGGVINDMTLRKMALFYIYWGIRALPQNRLSESHPALYDRLYEIVAKLGQVPVNQFSVSYTVGQDLESQIERTAELVRFALALEESYVREYNLDEVDSLLYLWRKHIVEGKHITRAKDWAKVSVWVQDASGTSADNRRDVFFLRKAEKKSAAKQVKKARKRQRLARKGH